MPTLFEFFAKIAGQAGGSLQAFFQKIAADYPDLADEAQKWIAFGSQSLDPANVAKEVGQLPTEVKDVIRGKLKPGDRPSDAI